MGHPHFHPSRISRLVYITHTHRITLTRPVAHTHTHTQALARSQHQPNCTFQDLLNNHPPFTIYKYIPILIFQTSRMRICAPQDKFSATSCTKRPHIGPTPIDYFQFGIGFVRLHLFHDGFFVLHTTNVFVFFPHTTMRMRTDPDDVEKNTTPLTPAMVSAHLI